MRDGIRALKAAQPNTRVLLAVGGSLYTNFTNFSTQCVKDLVDDLGFDGADLDWEPPFAACAASGGVVTCPTTDAQSVSVLTAMRSAFPKGQYILTVASFSKGAYGEGLYANSKPTGSPYTGINLAMAKSPAGQALDLINVMSYGAVAATGWVGGWGEFGGWRGPGAWCPLGMQSATLGGERPAPLARWCALPHDPWRPNRPLPHPPPRCGQHHHHRVQPARELPGPQDLLSKCCSRLGLRGSARGSGGNWISLADVTTNSQFVLANGGAGVMIWSLRPAGTYTPTAQNITTYACQAVGMPNCAAPIPY